MNVPIVIWMKVNHMKQSKIHAAVNKSISIVTMITVCLIAYPIYVQTQNLEDVRKVLDTFKTQLIGIIPVAAVILLCLAIAYTGHYIERIHSYDGQLALSSQVQQLNLPIYYLKLINKLT